MGAAAKFILGQLDPNKDAKRAGKLKSARLSKRLGRKIVLSDLEHVIANDLIFPENIATSLSSVGGLDHLMQTLEEKVLFPLRRPDLFRGSLLRMDKGMLLYGPPGTGKTLLAKGLAKESGAAFINISTATLLSKWYGETSKLVSALFRTAHKVAPCIIFIDEVDALLGRRKEGDHEATTNLKTEFMQLWDGMLTNSSSQVLLLGATNRPGELDAAVLRRFSLQLEVPMPNASQREAILRVMLQQHEQEVGSLQLDAALRTNSAAASDQDHPLQAIAQGAEGFSGSDLHQLCALAAARPVLQLARSGALNGQPARPLAVRDFEAALAEMQQNQTAAARQVQQAKLEALQQLRDMWPNAPADGFGGPA